jgi:ribosomal protein S18 acetylase RimI-like enzyme
MMRARDWREVPAEHVAPFYEAERARWMRALAWDMAPTLAMLEEGRVRGTVPGLIAYERDTPAGWTFFVPYDGTLQIGALHGVSTAIVRQLLDDVMSAPEAETAQVVSCFMHPASPAVASAFLRRRFEVARQLYLSRDLTDRGWFEAAPEPPSLDIVCGGWKADHAADSVRLLARCYAGSRAGRCFAPDNRMEQWIHYLRQLLTTPACGVVMPQASRMLRAFRGDGSGSDLVGFVLATSVAETTAHIAPLVVDPGWRGRQMGERLVRAACEAAREAGHQQVTLIVDEANTAACALYRRLGFTLTSEFVFAARPMPTRKRLKAA